MEIAPQAVPVTLATLRARLLERIRRRIQNGELTERGLARLCAISQPHMHHILKGARTLKVELADEMMRSLAIPLVDLLETTELPVAARRKPPQGQASTARVSPMRSRAEEAG